MTGAIEFKERFLERFIGENEYEAIAPQVKAADLSLTKKTGPGSDFLGWLDLPASYDRQELARIKAAGKKIADESEILVVIGIGGSYLGARSAIELLKGQNYNITAKHTPQIFFAGNSISPSALNELLHICESKELSVNVVSKSGTTTEPAIAFRAFLELMEKKYGAAAKKRIYVTTDGSKGALKAMAQKEGYETFTIAGDIGGRFSVLTAPGLLPMAAAGIDVGAVMEGAGEALRHLSDPDCRKNPCYRYAAARNILYRKGKTVEMLVGFEPDFAMTGEWYKQLFGESEGKDNKGIFPSSAVFSTDLHSMGQYIQQGRRDLFETFIWFDKPKSDYILKGREDDLDGLNYLEGKPMSYVNRMAMEGTLKAHSEGGTPCILLESEKIDEYFYGYMVYFFEKACAISGYLLGVNPFDQPGVEFYKKNMFELLQKPGCKI